MRANYHNGIKRLDEAAFRSVLKSSHKIEIFPQITLYRNFDREDTQNRIAQKTRKMGSDDFEFLLKSASVDGASLQFVDLIKTSLSREQKSAVAETH